MLKVIDKYTLYQLLYSLRFLDGSQKRIRNVKYHLSRYS